MIETVGPTPQQTATITDSIKEQDMGKDAFLRLLTVQLQNQDPLDPVKNEDFVAQLSQFSSLEQLQQINKAVTGDTDAQALIGVQQAIDSNTAVALIGREVDLPSDEINYIGQGNVRVGYHLTGEASRVDVLIYNEEGELVRTLTDDSPEAGNGTLVWDGKNDTTQFLSAGTYRVVPKAVNGEGNSVTGKAAMTGEVTGVRYQDGKPILVMDGAEAPLSGIGRVSAAVEE